MIDTLKLKSSPLTESQAEAIECQLHTKSDIDNSTGEALYCIIAGPIKGSFEVNPHGNVFRTEIVAVPNLRTGKVETITQPCEPFFVVEGSVHKAMAGHNIFGGPSSPVLAARWYVQHIEKMLGVVLPDGGLWQTLRIDWAECYQLDRYESCSEYLHGLSMARYPRRRPQRYADETIAFCGCTTSFKVYHKGPEFQKHDNARVARLFGKGRAEQLQILANGILRVETSIKAKKLKADFGVVPTVSMLDQLYCERQHDREAEKVMREGKSEMETVRMNTEVKARLYQLYEPRKAYALFGTWIQLAAVGEKEVRERLPRRTFYWQKKALTEAGVSWSGTDVHLRDGASLIPRGFSLTRNDPRRMVGECPEVTAALRSVA